MRNNLQSEYLEKTISKFNQDLKKGMSDITKEVFKASLINDRVYNGLETNCKNLVLKKYLRQKSIGNLKIKIFMFRILSKEI